jgi:predicted histidine transporter YuiF (NhaC family)
MLKIVYTFFLGLILAIFVGFGIVSFYTGPQRPDYPVTLDKTICADTNSKAYEEQKAAQIKFDQDTKDYEKLQSTYSQNVFIIALIAAVIILMISLTFARHVEVLSDGMLLGGIFTLCYAIGQSFTMVNNKSRFIMVTIGLIITLVAGYLKFIKFHDKKS